MSPVKYTVRSESSPLRSAHTSVPEFPVAPAFAGFQLSKAYFVTSVPDDVVTSCSIRFPYASYVYAELDNTTPAAVVSTALVIWFALLYPYAQTSPVEMFVLPVMFPFASYV